MSKRAQMWGARILTILLLSTTFITTALSNPAQAEGDVEWDTKLTYRLKVDQGTINLVSDVTITNKHGNRRDGNTIIQYYLDRAGIYVPEEATGLMITSDGEELTYTIEEDVEEDDEIVGLDLLDIRFPRRIFYNRSVDIRIEYDLPGDDPRSDSLFRVNPAYASFSVIAWGDPGRIEVVVMLDDQFAVDAWGSEYLVTKEGSDIVYTMTDIEDPDEWFMVFTARNDDRLIDSSADLEDFDVNIRSWPSDNWWASEVEKAVQAGLPVLSEMIGLDWRPEEVLEIRESIEPNLLGYGGWYLDTGDVIEIGEYVDRHLVLHEIGHSWFTNDLFTHRWITEGLSDEFAARTVASLGWAELTEFELEEDPPDRDGTFSPQLNEWVFPDGDESGIDQIEQYGYTASWWIMHQIVEEIGIDGISATIAAADADEIAYRGDGDPEAVDPSDDWRRFLDLVQEVGGSSDAPQLFDDWVLSEAESLDERDAARATYSELADEAGDWSMPLAVREPMSDWDFDLARARMAEASDVLEIRTEIDALTDLLGVEAPESLEAAYEDTGADFASTLEAANDLHSAAETVVAAHDAVEADMGLLESIGLIGEDPDAELEQAVTAFASDDLDLANSEANEAIALIDNADDVGTSRVAKTVGGVVALAVLITGLIMWKRRRSPEDLHDEAPEAETW